MTRRRSTWRLLSWSPRTPRRGQGIAGTVIEILVDDVVIRAPERTGVERLARTFRAARLAQLPLPQAE